VDRLTLAAEDDGDRTVRIGVNDEALAFADGEDCVNPPVRVARSHLLGQLADDISWGDAWLFDDGRVPLVACACYEPGCESIVVRITLTADEVIWTDVVQRQPPNSSGRKQDRAPLGTFRFDRSEYEQEIARVLGSAT
jgi:hypothetical protein